MIRRAVALLLITVLGPAAIALTRGDAVPVRILYDNSGSMYPGYTPPGSANRRTRADLAVGYFHQSPLFAQWLSDFVERQSILDARTVGMWTFTSDGSFEPGNIREVHPVVRVGDFNAANAIANFPDRQGNTTYLTETLEAFSRDFTGVLWLITDNIVETNAGEPDTGVQRFFEALASRPEYRSVHLFKYTFEEAGQTAALAVYGILVSAADVPDAALAYYDGKFRTLRDAKRRDGTELFPGREHLKLKNLEIEPMQLRADLQLMLADRDKGMFKEGQGVQLELDGEIRSYLTQHSVTAGRYELAISASFAAEDWAQRDLGAQPLAPQVFDSARDDIRQEIPPNGARRVHAVLRSAQPVSFTPSGPVEWLRLAWKGAAVRYTGAVRMTFTDVNVRLERQQMAGIFGIDHASSVFEFQDVTTLPQVRPSIVPVSFALRTGSQRTALLLLLMALLGAILASSVYVLSRKQAFEIAISGSPKTTVALRRLGTHQVTLESKLLGRLSRGLVGYAFDPVRGDREFSILPSTDGAWDVKFIAGGTRRLSIKAEGGGKPAAGKPAAAHSPGAPPLPPSARNVPPVPGRPPRIGR